MSLADQKKMQKVFCWTLWGSQKAVKSKTEVAPLQRRMEMLQDIAINIGALKKYFSLKIPRKGNFREWKLIIQIKLYNDLNLQLDSSAV